MPRIKLFVAVGVAVVASVVACVLLLISNQATASSPERAISTFVEAESQANLKAMEEVSSKVFFQNFIGSFGEAKFNSVRSVYQAAYDAAEPKWEQYRDKARVGALKEHMRLAQQIDKLGHAAFVALPADRRLQLMEDRARFNDFVFDEGVKALSAADRAEIADPAAFRADQDLDGFTKKSGYALLSDEDKAALKSPEALSSQLTPERMAFLESVGLAQLSAEQRKEIAGIPSSALNDAQGFMLRNGRQPALDFLKHSGLEREIKIAKCEYPAQQEYGSLFKGNSARCDFTISVSGVGIESRAWLMKQGGGWRVTDVSRFLRYIPQLGKRQNNSEQAQPQADSQTTRMPDAVAATTVQWPRLPSARWGVVSEPSAKLMPRDLLLIAAEKLLPERVKEQFVLIFLLLIGLIVFCVIMTINYRRLRTETFLPEWLEGETQLDEIEVNGWWSRVRLRLTNKRIVQVRLSWLFSRRRIFGIALDDIHSVTWRRYTNWLLILVSLRVVGFSNPIALLLLMWGLESKILCIRFNTPLAQMPFPRARVAVTSFRRRQFSELAQFYKKAQLYLAQVRVQKQLPVAQNASFIPEQDKDFAWGISVWIPVALWLVVALAQRTFGAHVTLEGVWAAVLLGLPIAAALHSLRSGIWAGVMGATALVSVKFAGSVGFVWFAKGADGGTPSLWQYAVLVVGAAVVAIGAWTLSRLHPLAVFAAPVLWLLPFAVMDSSLLGDARTYASCVIAMASAAAWLAMAGLQASKGAPPVDESEPIAE